jgi:hypothetical protein
MRYEITEMLDTRTGLIWMRQVKAELTFSEAHAYAKRLAKQTGRDWRLPTISELQTISDMPEIATLETFWSSDPVEGRPEYRWCLWHCPREGTYFHAGLAYYGQYAVRLVRSN